MGRCLASVVSVAYAFAFLALAAFLERRGQRNLDARRAAGQGDAAFVHHRAHCLRSISIIARGGAGGRLSSGWDQVSAAPSAARRGRRDDPAGGNRCCGIIWIILDLTSITSLGYTIAWWTAGCPPRWLVGLMVLFSYWFGQHYSLRPEHWALRHGLAVLAAIGWSGLLFWLQANLEVGRFLPRLLLTGRSALCRCSGACTGGAWRCWGFRWNKLPRDGCRRRCSARRPQGAHLGHGRGKSLYRIMLRSGTAPRRRVLLLYHFTRIGLMSPRPGRKDEDRPRAGVDGSAQALSCVAGAANMAQHDAPTAMHFQYQAEIREPSARTTSAGSRCRLDSAGLQPARFGGYTCSTRTAEIPVHGSVQPS